MRERRWLLLALYGLLLATAVSEALKATRPKFKIATTSTTTTTTEEPDVAENENDEIEATTVSSDVNATTGHTLTGIPQIDYIWDPNLPRELNGFNLSDYPFYNSIPEEINFKCDGLHDGFYASVPHRCQVYHHCLYGTRYDFLCANFTAFDQKTFICHFASEVDCVNSKKYWHRNDALYKPTETTTTSTTTTSTSTTTTAAPPPGRRPGGRLSGRRPFRRRPSYDYYEEEYYDDDAGYERTRPRGYDRRDDYDYDDRKYTRRDRDRDREFRDRDYRDRDSPRSREPERSERPLKDDREPPLSPRERFPSRNNRRDPPRTVATAVRESADEEPRNRNRDADPPMRSRDPEESGVEKKLSDSRDRAVVDDRRYNDKGDYYDDETVTAGSASSTVNPEVLVKPAAPVSSVYARPRAPPKIRRPVPLAEQDKFAYKATAAPPTAGEARRRPMEIPADDNYYDDEIEEVRPRRPATRRRPGFRDFYETPRDRDRDRPYRSRYRDDEEDTRPKKHPERIRVDDNPRSRKYPERNRPNDDDDARPRKYPERNRGTEDDDVRPRKHSERNRERYYERGPERGRDRSLDRSKERTSVVKPETDPAERFETPDKPISGRPNDRDKDQDRPRSSMRSSKEPAEISETTRRSNIYDRTSVAPPSQTSTTTIPEVHVDAISSQPPSDRPERPFRSGNRQEFKSSLSKNIATNEKSSTQTTQRNPFDADHDVRESVKPEKDEREREETPKAAIEESSLSPEKQRNESEEYSSIDYYDEPDYRQQTPAPLPPPRTAVRIVKRPFLPSRGGNPNPRGLSPVGSKAPEASRNEETQPNRSEPVRTVKTHSDGYRNDDNREDSQRPVSDDGRRAYDAYKVIQPDVNQQSRSETYEDVLSRPKVSRPEDGDARTGHRRPVDTNENPQPHNIDNNNNNNSGSLGTAGGNRGRNQEETRAVGRRPVDDNRDDLRPRNHEGPPIDREKPILKWNSDEYRQGQRGDVRHDSDNNGGSQNRGKSRPAVAENSGYYSDSYVKDNGPRDGSTVQTGNTATNKQIINEVVTHHRLQDIPESEYDVTLNDALTPSFNNQEGNLPSGFVLPIHRQGGRDALLQSTENSYKVSRPYNQPIQHNQQQQQQQQQKTFVPSPQFLPLMDVDANNERSRSVQYFRTPEAVHVTGPQYRHQRGPWHDYTGY